MPSYPRSCPYCKCVFYSERWDRPVCHDRRCGQLYLAERRHQEEPSKLDQARAIVQALRRELERWQGR